MWAGKWPLILKLRKYLTFVRSRFLISVLVFVSRDFELGRVWVQFANAFAIAITFARWRRRSEETAVTYGANFFCYLNLKSKLRVHLFSLHSEAVNVLIITNTGMFCSASSWFLAIHLLQEFFDNITQLTTGVAQFVKIVEKERSRQNEKYIMWDQLAAACVIDAAVICESKEVCASVELHDSETRGQMVVDVNTAHGKTYNVCIVTRVNQTLYEKLVTASFHLS